MYASARVGQPVELPIAQDHPYYTGWQQFMDA
jgi:ribosomal protein L31